MTEIFKRGEQIAYIPLHARQSPRDHPDIEYGFVTTQKGETVWCRFWRKGHPGELRTRANSEAVNVHSLVRTHSVPDSLVQGILRKIELDEKERRSDDVRTCAK